MQDITEALNQIIFKYHLDRYYPHYRNMYEADKILRRLVKEIADSGERAAFVCDDETGNGVIQSMAGDRSGVSFFLYVRDDLKTLEAEDWTAFDRVYLTSYYDAEYALQWFWQKGIACEWVYDVFEREGLCLEREFYVFQKELQNDLWIEEVFVGKKGRRNVVQLELLFQKMKLKYSGNEKTRLIAQEKCLFLCLCMRNFAQAERYVKQLEQVDGRVSEMWEEVRNLLDMIRSKLRERREKDVILYWLDAIPYGDERNMPYLKSRIERAVSFENAFTCTPYTKPTVKAMFCEKREVDDYGYRIKRISEENSPLMRFLRSQGYRTIVISGHFSESFEAEARTGRFYTPYDYCSTHFWDMLQVLLTQREKAFVIVHALEAHAPYLNSRMTTRPVAEDWRLRSDQATEDLDEQLACYDAFVGENAARIYMSDHGKIVWSTYFHILLSFYHKDTRPGKVKELFSILDFRPALEQLLGHQALNRSKFRRDYVEIQGLDIHSYALVERVLSGKSGLKTLHLGYKGVIDQGYIYVRYKTGKEILIRRDALPPTDPNLYSDNEICDASLLPYYRRITGEYPAGIDLDEKFQYSRYFYKLYQKILERDRVSEKIRAINELVEKYPRNSIAFRMGGGHSWELYSALSIENRGKIWGLVDRDSNCMCRGLGLRIISPEEIAQLPGLGVQAVILSSWDHLEELREESMHYPSVDILNIYDCFQEKGLPCEENFFEPHGKFPEDYDVGFPFRK